MVKRQKVANLGARGMVSGHFGEQRHHSVTFGLSGIVVVTRGELVTEGAKSSDFVC